MVVLHGGFVIVPNGQLALSLDEEVIAETCINIKESQGWCQELELSSRQKSGIEDCSQYYAAQ
jgi:hypothetical protein